MKRYFRDARKAMKLPIVLYDNPFRTNTVITPETIATMAHEGIIVGMKASSTDLYHLDHVAQRVGVEFGILSGQDTLFVEQVLLGARGGVLTSACLIPGYWNAIQADAERGRVKEALAAPAPPLSVPRCTLCRRIPGRRQGRVRVAWLADRQVHHAHGWDAGLPHAKARGSHRGFANGRYPAPVLRQVARRQSDEAATA